MKRQGGFTTIEIMIGTVIGGIVLAGAFGVWKSSQEEGHRLQKKNQLRDQMALASKQIQRSITLAGTGMGLAPNLVRADAVGSDTLMIFTNQGEARSSLVSNPAVGQYTVFVADGSIFQNARFLALADTARGEVKPIDRVQGTVVILGKPLERSYDRMVTMAIPAKREKYYSDQESKTLIRMVDGQAKVMGEDILNFQVSFRDRRGASTNDPRQARTVWFSYTGTFPAREGALNSLLFTSTAIPRNVL